MNRFYFLEPSKVRHQHITLLEGYLKALISSDVIKKKFKLIFCASKSTILNLPELITFDVKCVHIPVIDPERRRFVFKTFLELFVILNFMFKLRRGDVLFISCLLPTTLWLLEISNRLLCKDGVHIVLHGEIEGIFSETPIGFRSIGYWAAKWIHSRKKDSFFTLVVLDDFIRDKIIGKYVHKIDPHKIFVIHHPIINKNFDVNLDEHVSSVCFIGIRSKYKGFDDFAQLASSHPLVNFLAIGGGKVENLSHGEVNYIKGKDAYLNAISKCSAAVFPYKAKAYNCTLSAAALDALATGVHIIALDNPYFQNLALYFGSDIVSIYSSFDAIRSAINNDMLRKKMGGRELRLKTILGSKYSIPAVQRSFERLVRKQTK